MNRTQYVLLVALVVLSSLLGGALSGELFAPLRAVAAEMGVKSDETLVQKTVIRTRKLELVDKEGKARAAFGMAKGENPVMVLYDKSGGISFLVEMDSEGRASLYLQGKRGSHLALKVWPTGSPGLLLRDQRGKVRSVLRLSEKGGPALVFDDETGKSRVIVGELSPDVTTAPLPPTPISSLILLDKSEKVIWKAPQ